MEERWCFPHPNGAGGCKRRGRVLSLALVFPLPLLSSPSLLTFIKSTRVRVEFRLSFGDRHLKHDVGSNHVSIHGLILGHGLVLGLNKDRLNVGGLNPKVFKNKIPFENRPFVS